MNHSFALGLCQKERQFGVILQGYWRSSAAYRLRIVLNLKRPSVEHAFHHLRKNGQRQPDYLRLNPLGLVPALELDGGRSVLTQSLATCKWLKEMHPEPRLPPAALSTPLLFIRARCVHAQWISGGTIGGRGHHSAAPLGRLPPVGGINSSVSHLPIEPFLHDTTCPPCCGHSDAVALWS